MSNQTRTPAPATDVQESLQALPAGAMDALLRGQLLEAVRVVHEQTGLGLRESKALVERHRAEAMRLRGEQVKARVHAFAREHGLQVPQAATDALGRGELLAAVNLVRKTNRIGITEAGRLMRSLRGKPPRQGNTIVPGEGRHGWAWLFLLLVAGLLVSYGLTR